MEVSEKGKQRWRQEANAKDAKERNRGWKRTNKG